MKKTFGHAVIYDGVFYPANTPIEVKEEKPVEVKEEKPIEVKEETAEVTEKKPTKKRVKKNDNGADSNS